MTPAQFLLHIDRTAGFFGCWLWQGGVCAKGYGRVRLNGRPSWAHRVAYQQFVGPIPDGMAVCHTCDNPPCCNPAHLFVGTLADNHADMVAKGRQARGGRTGNRRLTASIVSEIRRAAVAGERRQVIASQFSVHTSTVSRLVRRERWAWFQES